MLRLGLALSAVLLACSTSQPSSGSDASALACSNPASLPGACPSGECPLDWATAADAATWCGAPFGASSPYMNVSTSTNDCQGVRAVFASCCKDVGWAYYFNVDSGTLVGRTHYAGNPSALTCAGTAPVDCATPTTTGTPNPNCCTWQQSSLQLDCVDASTD